MTPKEKAQELIKRFTKDKIIVVIEYAGANPEYSTLSEREAKHCALIAVDEILYEHPYLSPHRLKFWQEVKHEIENL